jgi:Fur family peroxide stress response transcriptional regulator
MVIVQIMRHADQESDSEGLGDRLHRAGLRTTLPRRAVFAAVEAESGHATAEEIRRTLRTRGIDLPRSSVNNVLDRLSQAGLIGRVDTVPGPARFEAETSPHDHFHCRVCKAIINVGPTRIESPPRLPGSPTQVATTYLGTCHGCAEK